jgi:hypothetical protein
MTIRLRALTKDDKKGLHDVNSNVLASKTKRKSSKPKVKEFQLKVIFEMNDNNVKKSWKELK